MLHSTSSSGIHSATWLLYTNSTCTHYTRLTKLAGIVGLKLYLLDYYLKKSFSPIVAKKNFTITMLTDWPTCRTPKHTSNESPRNTRQTPDGPLTDPWRTPNKLSCDKKKGRIFVCQAFLPKWNLFYSWQLRKRHHIAEHDKQIFCPFYFVRALPTNH